MLAVPNLPLSETHPHLVQQWHPSNQHTPDKVTAGSKQKTKWECEKGHTWVSTIANRVNGTGCPVCSNRIILPGYNDFASKHPQLLPYWNYSKNDVQPTEISSRSGKKIWWLFPCGHERYVSPDKATRNQNFVCLHCSGRNKKVLAGVNDLVTTHPEIAEEWDHSKNGSLKPEQFVAGSHKQIWWLCKAHAHSWQTSIKHRTLSNSGCPYCAGQKVLAGFNDLQTTNPEVAHLWSSSNTTTTDEVTKGATNRKYLWECDKGHTWASLIPDIIRGNRCPECAKKKFVSKAEQELFSYTESLGVQVEQQNRSLIGAELDLYFPNHHLAVEFNGVYWHSEFFTKTPKTRHHRKWLKCQEKGIQLVQIWEDDWNRNSDLVKRMIAHKLGVSQERKVYARKTTLSSLSVTAAQSFLNENHIQGYSSGSYYLGLSDEETQKLVAVLVLKKEPGTNGKTLNIIRYATSCNVVGGFTKLLKHAERTYAPEKFITFSDHCISDGGLYKKNGFIADKELPPDYMYVVKGIRKHKFGYRLKKFRDDPNLLWEEGLSERELAALNRIPRIWDAGKTRWVKHLTG